jgi:hypothetical protein
MSPAANSAARSAPVKAMAELPREPVLAGVAPAVAGEVVTEPPVVDALVVGPPVVEPLVVGARLKGSHTPVAEAL